MSSAMVCKGEKAKLLSSWGNTAEEAFTKMGILVDTFMKNEKYDWLLQGVNVFHEEGIIHLTATISRLK